jgi:RND family efflux transporter MFP subunit
MMNRMRMSAGLLVCALAAAAGCSSKEAEKAKVPPVVVQGVTAEQVKSGPLADMLEAVGTVTSRNAARIAARIPGTVATLAVREGDRVRKGQLLLTLASPETGAGAAAAEAAVEEARRGLEEARSRRKLTDVTFQRFEKLYQQQAVTAQEFDEKRTAREQGAEGVARAEARLRQAEAASRSSAAVAGYGRITAPIGGLVTAKPVELGQTVFPGTPLLTVEDEGALQLVVAVPESLLGKVKPGMRVPVSVDGAPSVTEGTVAEVVAAVDPASRTFTVKLDLPAQGLRSGSYGRAVFPAGEKTALTVPASAVVTKGALTSVWVVGEDGIARMRLVKTGAATGGRTEVLAGLADGDRVVTVGVEKVTDGVQVK